MNYVVDTSALMRLYIPETAPKLSTVMEICKTEVL